MHVPATYFVSSPVPALLLALVVALGASGCDQRPAGEEEAGDHVFKGQVEAIDKAREVETMLRQKSDAQQ